MMTLETHDGVHLQGYSFGAEVSSAGEVVFQTGMVGYPESLTDPSYEGQILVITYPLVGNYGVPDRDEKEPLAESLPRWFESNRIHVAGLVVAHYTEDYSHFLANSSLGQWLKQEGIPAVYGVDTRSLTKRLREKGSTLGRLCLQKSGTTHDDALNPELFTQNFQIPEWDDPNVKNLVAKVSTPKPVLYECPANIPKRTIRGRTIRILAVDVGMKNNQIRCFLSRGVDVLVVPWDYDFSNEEYDGLFVSNGPGDPSVMEATVDTLRKVLEKADHPVFGICLGHQLLARAAGAGTIKLKFGNRGQNIPCTSTVDNKCYITSQNHGFAVDAATLKDGWKELFFNANDNSNEGIYHTEKPFFSVQFHPEAAPGPTDTEFLFDKFINAVSAFHEGQQGPVFKVENKKVAEKVSVKKVLVLGSGGLSIGQAGEFDYSGSQAIKALKEEGIYTVLINPNIATIQTSKGLADKVYFLPVNPDFVRKVINYEKPDAIYVTFGGQTALNVGIALKDEFADLGVQVLGTPIDTIIMTEDRDMFARAMEEIHEHCAKSATASTWEEAKKAAADIGFPVIVRAAYALGGLGSGFADNEQELEKLCSIAFASSPQVLVERSMKGWKEVEYEVVRDAYDNCITVCNMENFDPLGIHTGDSIVVAPSQTLSDADYQMLRSTAVKVIRHLGVVGECNIQYALNPHSKEYCIIEVNARLSRSSALASKATGYPLAYTAAKLGLNIRLNEVKNSVTRVTCACFEPSLDYCVVKMPRWDLRKFQRVSSELSSAMKSVGEVMSVGRTFEEAIQKAVRSVDYSNLGIEVTENDSQNLDVALSVPSDRRLFAVVNALGKGYSVDKVHSLTNIDRWFLNKLNSLVEFAGHVRSFQHKEKLPVSVLRQAKQLGFDDRQLAVYLNSNEVAIRRLRTESGIVPRVKQIDTVAAEFPAFTNYLYVTYSGDADDVSFEERGVMVLGSGVYRIGSSVEFDWCAVRAVRTLREMGFRTVMVNYNPETVSTDYDEADRLYFEPITLERVLDIYEAERSSGVLIAMGGQTSNNIALPLHRQGVRILGTSPEMIDGAENRYKFSRMLDRLGVDQPAWKELTSFDEAETFAAKVGYPVLVRPSYVLSGAAMNTVYSSEDLSAYLSQAVEVSPDFPVVISKYIEQAKEIEMDAVAKDGKLIMHVVSEHVENAGVHSGDATLICPPQDLAVETVNRIVEATARIGHALDITGPFNIQFIAKDNAIKVIECNVRASRSFPFVSKVVGTDLIELATRAIMDQPFTPYPKVNLPEDYCAVKVPQFSFPRLAGADPVLGVEMASTGEVATFGHTKWEAYLKALISTGFKLPNKSVLISVGSFKEKLELLPTIRKLDEMNFKLYATAGTADFIQEHGIPVQYLEALPADEEEDQRSEYSLSNHLANNLIDLYINLPSANRYRRPASYVSPGYRTRRMAVDYGVPLVTNVKNAKLLVEAMARYPQLDVGNVDAQSAHTTASVAGFVDLASFFQNKPVSLSAGFTVGASQPADFLVPVRPQDVHEGQAQNGVLVLEGDALPHADVLAEWPQSRPVFTNAKGANLAAVLLLASLNERSLHVSGVNSIGDLNLIATVKARNMKVTCDVAVSSLGSFWEELSLIDCFSVEDPSADVATLLEAVATNRLSLDDVVEKLSVAPLRVLAVAAQNSVLELDLDRRVVERVVIDSETVALEGSIIGAREGRLITPAISPVSAPPTPQPAAALLKRRQSRVSFSTEDRTPLDLVSKPPRELSPPSALSSFIRNNNPFLRRSVLSVNQFSRAHFHALFSVAQEMRLGVEREGIVDILKGRILATMFYEPSTRTSSSFNAAMQRLGGQVVAVNEDASSSKKGETLQDTIRTLACYSDAIVLRHPSEESAHIAAKYSPVPIINGGNGSREHPTQAFLDLFTIREELGTVNGITVTFMGDLKYGRPVHSLCRLLRHYQVRVQLVAPPQLRLPDHLKQELVEAGMLVCESEELTKDIIARSDVLYCTRVQKERFSSEDQFDQLKDAYVVDNKILAHAKQHMCVMHPLPRVNEIKEEVDFDQRAAYFRQMKYGLYVRMALLAMVIGIDF